MVKKGKFKLSGGKIPGWALLFPVEIVVNYRWKKVKKGYVVTFSLVTFSKEVLLKILNTVKKGE